MSLTSPNGIRRNRIEHNDVALYILYNTVNGDLFKFAKSYENRMTRKLSKPV